MQARRAWGLPWIPFVRILNPNPKILVCVAKKVGTPGFSGCVGRQGVTNFGPPAEGRATEGFVMVKKAILGGAGAALVCLVLFGREAASYVGTTVGWCKDSVKSNVPISFEIDRARRMVKDLVPDIRKNMHMIAKEEVEVDRLAKQIAESEKRLGKDPDEVMRLKADLSSDQQGFQ